MTAEDSASLSSAPAPAASERRRAALALHGHLCRAHWDAGHLSGPDPGVRLNYRVGRFVKWYLRRLPWHDDLAYLQGQGYWVLANWQLHDLGLGERPGEVATRCADWIVTRQRGDGAWEYPNPEWRGRIATVEGTWAALSLLETWRRTQDDRYLTSVRLWQSFLEREIRFRPAPGGVAVNYFAGRAGAPVPNNSALILRLLAEFATTTGDRSVLQHQASLLSFLRTVQKATGELPYSLTDSGAMEHFQCYQYNAFECLDLMRFVDLTGDAEGQAVVDDVLRFLARGQAADGHAPYACDSRRRRVTYHTAVLAAAFSRAVDRGAAIYRGPASAAFAHVLSLQRSDGSFPHSSREYGLLSDGRSYPRYQSMILHHLLLGLSGLTEPDRT